VHQFRQSDYLYFAIGIIGATIAPWQQFYLQASVVEKGSTKNDLKYSQIDAIFGSLFSVIVAAFIIIVCAATLYSHGFYQIQDAADAAQALRPLGGEYTFILFSVGLLNASLFAACILPLSSAYTVCHALGFEAGLNRRFKNARIFYGLYTSLLVVGGLITLIPQFPLVRVAILSQVLNGILLPFVLVFMLLLANNSKLMGEYKISRPYNFGAWSLTAVIVILTVLMLATSIDFGK
jgi:Mn2+/Fe2+ NRAMP family transporter